MSDKKPWEIELVVEKGTGERRGDRWLYMAGTDQDVCCIPEETPGGADAWAALLSASKEMVALLLFDLDERWHTADCSPTPTASGNARCSSPICLKKRAALAKAGVPLP